jgi:predicted dehydrogenase
VELHGTRGWLSAVVRPKAGDFTGSLIGSAAGGAAEGPLPIPDRLAAGMAPRYPGDSPRSLFFARLAQRFVESIRTRRSLSPNFQDGVKAQRVLHAVVESGKQGAWAPVG